MEKRISTLYTNVEPQYAVGSPLLLEACALHLDQESNSCIAQIKWKNIGNQTIKAVRIELICKDAFKHSSKPQYYELHPIC